MTEAKKRGRPVLPDAVRRRKNQTFRVRDSLHQALADLAKKNQRSISEEIEFRIERSFRDDDVRELLREAVGGYGVPKLKIVS